MQEPIPEVEASQRITSQTNPLKSTANKSRVCIVRLAEFKLYRVRARDFPASFKGIGTLFEKFV